MKTFQKNKFRAWDNNQKHFVYFELFNGVNNHTPPIYSFAELEPWERFIGILDDKKVEVYENDKVAVYKNDEMPDHDEFIGDGGTEEDYQKRLEESLLCRQTVTPNSDAGGYLCDEDNGEYSIALGDRDQVTVIVEGNTHEININAK